MEKQYTDILYAMARDIQEWFDNLDDCIRVAANYEYHGTEATYWEYGKTSFPALKQYLIEAGYHVLGCGHYSIVIACPFNPNYVIKVGHGAGGNGDIMLDGWLSWAAFSMMLHQEGKDYPFLPVVHDIVFGTSQEWTRGIYVALIDKYDFEWKEVRDCNTDVDIDIHKYYDAVRDAMEIVQWGYTSPMYKARVEKGNAIVNQVLEVLEHPMCPVLSDTHTGNFMVDLYNAVVVITDPSSSDYTMKPHRGRIFNNLGINTPELPLN